MRRRTFGESHGRLFIKKNWRSADDRPLPCSGKRKNEQLISIRHPQVFLEHFTHKSYISANIAEGIYLQMIQIHPFRNRYPIHWNWKCRNPQGLNRRADVAEIRSRFETKWVTEWTAMAESSFLEKILMAIDGSKLKTVGTVGTVGHWGNKISRYQKCYTCFAPKRLTIFSFNVGFPLVVKTCCFVTPDEDEEEVDEEEDFS